MLHSTPLIRRSILVTVLIYDDATFTRCKNIRDDYAFAWIRFRTSFSYSEIVFDRPDDGVVNNHERFWYRATLCDVQHTRSRRIRSFPIGLTRATDNDIRNHACIFTHPYCLPAEGSIPVYGQRRADPEMPETVASSAAENTHTRARTRRAYSLRTRLAFHKNGRFYYYYHYYYHHGEYCIYMSNTSSQYTIG